MIIFDTAPGTLLCMGSLTSYPPEYTSGTGTCPVCAAEVHISNRTDMVFHHPSERVAVGEHPAPWCTGGGLDATDPDTRLQAVPAMPPHRDGSGCWVLHQMPTELAKVNPRTTQLHLWDHPQCFAIRPPVALNEWNGTYSWLVKVTRETWPVVRSVTAAYRIAKMMHLARWPDGTPDLPGQMLVTRRLEREATA